MAISAAMAGLIGGASSGLGSGLAGHFNRKQVRETNQFNYETEERRWLTERQWARADQKELNAYNSPTQQMQRFKEAGLSPHLIYGGMSNAAPVRSGGSAPASNSQPPQYNPDTLGGMVNAYISLSQTMAQTDNLKAQNKVIEADQLLKQAQIKNVNQNTELGKYNLDFKQQTTQQNIERIDLGNQKLKADILYTLDQNERSQLASTQNIAKTVQEIALLKLQKAVQMEGMAKSQQERAKMREDIKHIQALVRLSDQEAKIKQIHNEMYKAGMTPSDPAYMRVMIEAANSVGNSIQSIINKFKTPTKNK